jgi:hypothetical protein
MHKLTVTLKQHTPLIHFQHPQEGATLRATEVKPKLDRFILTKLGENPCTDDIKIGEREALKEDKNFAQLPAVEKGRLIAKGKQWLVGKGDNPALNYKMQIVSQNGKYYDLKLNPTYFGNQIKSTKFNMNELFISKLYDDNLKQKFIDYLPKFFANNNFASRQTKGNGSYTVIEIKDNDKIIPIPEDEMEKMFENCLGRIDNVPSDLVFQAINTYWKLLKSGINIFYGSPIYEKAFIINQLGDSTWDKAWLKQNLLSSRDKSAKAFFVRALLGLPETIRFRSHTKKYKLYDDYIVNIKNSHVERIKAPIIFKPIKKQEEIYTVYILFNNHPEDLFDNKTYKFKFSFEFIEDIKVEDNKGKLKVEKRSTIPFDSKDKTLIIEKMKNKQTALCNKLQKLSYEYPKEPRLKYLNGGCDGKPIPNQLERLKFFLDRTDINNLTLDIPNDFDYRSLITKFHKSKGHIDKLKQIISEKITITSL